MRFTPLSEEEIKESNLFEPGIYNFEVLEALDKISKSGNEMIELKIKIWDNNGKEKIIYDYLLEMMKFKLKHFSECVSLEDKYNDGGINANDCIGKSGELDLIIYVDKKGRYADKNAVKDYIVNKDKNDISDDIPF